jgi:hypothetical protein
MSLYSGLDSSQESLLQPKFEKVGDYEVAFGSENDWRTFVVGIAPKRRAVFLFASQADFKTFGGLAWRARTGLRRVGER